MEKKPFFMYGSYRSILNKFSKKYLWTNNTSKKMRNAIERMFNLVYGEERSEGVAPYGYAMYVGDYPDVFNVSDVFNIEYIGSNTQISVQIGPNTRVSIHNTKIRPKDGFGSSRAEERVVELMYYDPSTLTKIARVFIGPREIIERIQYNFLRKCDDCGLPLSAEDGKEPLCEGCREKYSEEHPED